MPRYVYECSCGLKFERQLAITQVSAPQSCSHCGRVASRVTSTIRLAYGVSHVKPSEPKPGNSGLSGIDDIADRAIGAAAAAGWRVAQKRRDGKIATLEANPGAKPEDLRNRTDHYEVIPTEEGSFRQRADQMVDPARTALTKAAQQERKIEKITKKG